MASKSDSDFIILGPSKRSCERRMRSRRSGWLLQRLIDVSEGLAPMRRAALPAGPLYRWLEDNLPTFFRAVGQRRSEHQGLITDYGDKCYQYRESWKRDGIPFCHGAAIYLLSYTYPYNMQVRDTKDGWDDVETWVARNYAKFRKHLPPADPDPSEPGQPVGQFAAAA